MSHVSTNVRRNPYENLAVPPEAAEVVQPLLDRRSARWQREESYPHVRLVFQLAQATQWSLEMIEALLELAEQTDAPVEPGDAEGITWTDLAVDLAGWKWAFVSALTTLRSNFTADVQDALDEWTEEDDAGEQTAEEPADTPAIAELPASRSRPYWLS